MSQLSDEAVWPTWYTVQVWNAPDDLFMRTSYASKDLAISVARNLDAHYAGRMHKVSIKRWDYEATEMELTGEENG